MFFRTFRNWFRQKKEVRASPREHLLEAVRRVEQLPPLSETAVRAMALARNPDASFGEFAALIKRDGALTAVILKVANCVLYQSSYPVDTIEKATVRLGIRGCSQTISAFAMKATFRPTDGRMRTVCEVLWKHSLFTASICTLLNQSLKLGYGGEEFSAGLLHDVGRLMLATANMEAFDSVDSMDFLEGPELPDQERSKLDTDHCEIGAEYGVKSRLPKSVVNCLLHHHNCERADEDGRLVALVALSDELSNHVLRERNISNFNYLRSRPYWVLNKDRDRDFHKLFPLIIANLVRKAVRETRAQVKSQS